MNRHADIVEVPLSNGGVALVSSIDADCVLSVRWHRSRERYAIGRVAGRTVAMHRFIMQPPRNRVVDHRDGDRLNNTRENLRVCTHRENASNKGPRRGKRFRGVTFDRARGAWSANAVCGGWYHRFGFYATEEEAARAFDIHAAPLYGEFFRPNLPDATGPAPTPLPPRPRGRPRKALALPQDAPAALLREVGLVR